LIAREQKNFPENLTLNFRVIPAAKHVVLLLYHAE